MNENDLEKLPTQSFKPGNFLGRVVRKFVVLSLIFLAALIVMSLTASPPQHLGLHGGKLAPVPQSPNCVSSMTEKDSFQADPIDVAGVDQPLEKLKRVIEAEIPRSTLVSEEGNYLCYEFSSLIFRFVDDGEFLLNSERNVIDFRSGSRVGHSDIGANRKRMEKIRAAMKN